MSSQASNRFVILRHECGPANGGAAASHWDLMVALPEQEKLLTWQVAADPAGWGGRVAGERIADHRRAYLTYEGEISGDRGHVRRVDEGEAEVLGRSPWRLRLRGAVVHGDIEIAEEA